MLVDFESPVPRQGDLGSGGIYMVATVIIISTGPYVIHCQSGTMHDFNYNCYHY